MRNLFCVSDCAFTSLKDMVGEHLFIILAAMAVGAFFGAALGGIGETLAGAGIGLLLAIAYGCIPRVSDCFGKCRIQQSGPSSG